MKAMVYDRYGDATVLHPAELPKPNRLPGQIIIEVMVSSVNPVDYRMRQGEMRGLIPFGFPRIPGYDVAGVIAESADDSRFSEGDRVMAFLNSSRGGACADYVTCAINAAAKIPNEMTFEEAAAIPLAGSTALQALREHGQMKKGERVLINGASGGVGAFAIQIAKAAGCHVDAVASGDNEEFCLSLGADRFFNYNTTKFNELAEQWDLIFDAAGKSDYLEVRKVLRKDGRYVTTEPDVKGMLTTILTWPLARKGKWMLAKPRSEDLDELVRLWSQGSLKVAIDSRFPLDRIAEAHQRVEQGVDHGKVVVLHTSV